MRKIAILLPVFVLLLTSTTAFAGEKSAFTPTLFPEITKTVHAWNMAPSNFMAEGRTNIYLENVKKPMHAWILAFVPGAYSILTTMLNKSWDQSGDESTLENSKFYFMAIPGALGTLYAERYLEACVIWAGQAVGSYFIFSYFNLPRGDRNARINDFYMGVGIYAFFWVFDMIYAPIMSYQYNKKLAKLYLTEPSKSAEYEAPIAAPSNGNALVGPGIHIPTPFTVGATFNF